MRRSWRLFVILFTSPGHDGSTGGVRAIVGSARRARIRISSRPAAALRSAPDHADPSGRLARLYDSVISVLGRACDQRPFALTLEDIHWADGSTRDLIRFLGRNLRNERLLVVATYRSDDLHRRHPLMPLLAELERADTVERIELPRFDRAELAEQLVGDPRCSAVRPSRRCPARPFRWDPLLCRGAGRSGSRRRRGDPSDAPRHPRSAIGQRSRPRRSRWFVRRPSSAAGSRMSASRPSPVWTTDALVGALRDAIDARDPRHGR